MRDPSPAPTKQGERDWILHVDLDQFLAAVEVLRRPELEGRPVVVGGDGDPTRPRQVVATASYEARASGVRSGMPLRTAARKCPDAVFLPSDRPAYEAASAEVMATPGMLSLKVIENCGAAALALPAVSVAAAAAILAVTAPFAVGVMVAV